MVDARSAADAAAKDDTRLADGVLPTMGNGTGMPSSGTDAGGSSTPSFYLTPGNGSGGTSGGVRQQGLSQ